MYQNLVVNYYKLKENVLGFNFFPYIYSIFWKSLKQQIHQMHNSVKTEIYDRRWGERSTATGLLAKTSFCDKVK